MLSWMNQDLMDKVDVLVWIHSVGFTLHNLAGTYLQQHNYEQARLCYEVIHIQT